MRAGDLVILDNLATHKIRGVREAIQSHDPRTETDLLLAAKTAFQSISIIDCKGFFFSAKYAT